jgi:hypothetical protein
MTISSIIHLVAVILSVVAGIGVLRNPIKTPLNIIAGCCYIVAAIAAFWLNRWWPLPVGWIASLSIQGVEMWRFARGHYNERVNTYRVARGLPPLEGETHKN